MPKKQKSSKYHVSWKVAAVAAGVTLLVVAATAQFLFNQFVWRELQQHAVFNTRALIADSINDLTDQKSKIGTNGRIPEAKLQLPRGADAPKDVLYYYSEAIDDAPEMIQVTTRDLTEFGLSQMNGTNIDELFARLPEAQACSRGFTVQFTTDESTVLGDNVELASKKVLADGRTMLVWRETSCGDSSQPNTDKYMRYEAMSELEKYLLQAQSL